MMLRQLHWQVPALDVTVLSTAQMRRSFGTCDLHVYVVFALAYCRSALYQDTRSGGCMPSACSVVPS